MPSTVSDALLDADLTFSSPPFSTLLDARLLRALADLKFAHPTLVQATAIPLLLEGKDVLARARTGSGKTGAYVVPAVQRVLELKTAAGPTSPEYQVPRVAILVPTRELAMQVAAFIKSLTTYCEGLVSAVNVAAGGASVQRVLLNDNPDVIIATPSKLLSLLQAKAVDLSHLAFLAIDEADLLLSYGHKDDLTRIMDPASGFVPKLGVQGCLMSATLSEEIEGVKGLILRNPAILTLNEPAAASSLLTHYYCNTSERDKFLLIYVLLKLRLIRGRAIVFVNDVERGYRLRLFLEQFGVRTCVVNSELPLASRYHVVEEFNRGVYDVVVATDEGAGEAAEEAEAERTEAEAGKATEAEAPAATDDADAAQTSAEPENAEAGPSKRRASASPPPDPSAGRSKRARRQKQPKGSMARGIDFTAASSVINFDLPTSATSYLHRVGRTARAGHTGLALSFVVPADRWGKDGKGGAGISLKSARDDEAVFARIRKRVAAESGADIKAWDWGGRKGEIEGFRYRMEDALRAVTGKRVLDARRDEVRRELLNSDKLKAHFAANPLDLAYLRHDAPLHAARTSSHLKHVPGYLMPKIAAPHAGAAGAGGDAADGAHVGFAKRGGGAGRGRGRGRGRGGAARGGKKVDPLKFKA